MEPKDLPEFLSVMTGVTELYGKEMSDATLEIYFDALAGYALDEVSRAISAHVRNPDSGQFFPKPSDIIKMMAGTSRDTSFLAWTMVDKTVRIVGPYPSVCFDDPLINLVLDDMGGWISLCEKDDKEWPFVARDFQARYQAYKTKGEEITAYPATLIGISDADNMRQGYPFEPPLLIGDTKKAQAVLDCAKGAALQIRQATTNNKRLIS